MRTDRAIEEHPNTRALRWYQAVYRLFYRLGLWIVWNRAAAPAELVALVEGPCGLPAGRALDLGCRGGTDTIYLATHGWVSPESTSRPGRWPSPVATPPPLALPRGSFTAT